MLKGVPTKPWVKDYRKRAGSRLTEVISLAASLSTCPECPPQVHNSHSLIHKQGYMRSGANVMHCNLLATYGRIFPQKISHILQLQRSFAGTFGIESMVSISYPGQSCTVQSGKVYWTHHLRLSTSKIPLNLGYFGVLVPS